MSNASLTAVALDFLGLVVEEEDLVSILCQSEEVGPLGSSGKEAARRRAW